MAHEIEDPKNYLIVAIGLGSVVTLVATMYGLGSYYDVLRDKEQHDKVLGKDNPELVSVRAEEERKLTHYAKLDTKGRVRIPIDRAITLLAQRGRDGVPSIKPDATLSVIEGTPTALAAAAAAAASASAAPAVSGSAPPASSAPPAAPPGSAKPLTGQH